MKSSKLKNMAKTDVAKMLSDCNSLKPDDLIIDDLKWKYMVWSVLRGKNILFLGPTRCGKTKAAQSVAKALNREDKFLPLNLGSTQDARATLIGNSFYKKEEGTIFAPSKFVQAVQTPDSVIMLDELSRGHHDAWNILMPVLDPTQRYLRLDESEDSAVIPVAKGVTFIATANVGNEFTSTKVMDKALTARFPTIIEMKPLGYDDEMKLLKVLHPTVDQDVIEKFIVICKISDTTKTQFKMEESKLTTFIPTGTVVEIADMILDGFELSDIAESVIYPLYDDGGVDSERLYVKQLVQKYIDKDASGVKSPINDPVVDKGGDAFNF